MNATLPANKAASRKKPYKGIGMVGPLATWYAKITRKSMSEFESLAARLSKELPPGARVLEVAPGPGYLAIELSKRGVRQIVGLDISQTCVEIARAQARGEGVDVDFKLGNASAMPFAEGEFDFIVCRAAFKNFTNPIGALDEMHRVLKPGGRALIIDLNKRASLADIDEEVLKMGLGRIDSLMTRLTFRYMLIPFAYSNERFSQMAAQSRFRKVEINESGIGLELALKKERN